MDNKELGDGRWLIVQNTDVNPICIPHYDRDANDDEHLSLAGFEAKTIDDGWLEHPPFIRQWDIGRLAVYRSDELPDNSLTVGQVVAELKKRNWEPTAAVTIYQICASQPVPDYLKQLIRLEPSEESRVRHGPTFVTNRWDLVREQLPWLREILALEKRWRKRGRFIHDLEDRIQELEALARSGV